MAALIRSAASLPRVPMARIPLAALATSHIAPMSHANSAHPSAFSSMPSTRKGASNWAQSANTIADKLEDSAEKLSQDYLREADKSNLSKHASDAIRMVESHHVLKQDRAPIHDVSNEDPSEKDLGSQKHA